MTQYKKEKAKTLYNNFYENYNMSKQEARECALFVVDELSKEFTRHTDDYNFYNELRAEIDRYYNQLCCEHT